jgi:hypothetical protein
MTFLEAPSGGGCRDSVGFGWFALIAVVVLWQESKPIVLNKISKIRNPVFFKVSVAHPYSNAKELLAPRDINKIRLSRFFLERSVDCHFLCGIERECRFGLKVLSRGSEIFKRERE